MKEILWWFGWNMKLSIILAVFLGVVAGMGVHILLGIPIFAAILVLWYMGTQYINSNWQEFFESAKLLAAGAGAAGFDLDPEKTPRYPMWFGKGSMPQIEPPVQYIFNIIYLADDFLGIYEHDVYDLSSKKHVGGIGNKKVPYEQVQTIQYTFPFVELTVKKGEDQAPVKYQYRSERIQAEEAVRAVTEKIDTLKKKE